MELADVRAALTRIQSEYAEMPEMKLTVGQASWLLALPPDACDVALATLVQVGFLVRSGDGSFRRGSAGFSRHQTYAASVDQAMPDEHDRNTSAAPNHTRGL